MGQEIAISKKKPSHGQASEKRNIGSFQSWTTTTFRRQSAIIQRDIFHLTLCSFGRDKVASSHREEDNAMMERLVQVGIFR